MNGKALTLGLRLADMELRDMLDVVHYFFEQDSRYSSAEEAESVSSMRTTLYRQLYKTTYRYPVKATANNSSSASNEYNDLDEVKPYIPPTEFNPDSYNPFGQVLDAPIG